MKTAALARGAPLLLAQVASGLLITFLVVGLSVAQIAHWAGDDLADREHARLQTAAQGIAMQLAATLAERTGDLHLLRDLIEAGPPDAGPDLARGLLDKLRAAQPQFSWLGVVEPTGRIGAASGRLLEGQQVTCRDWFEGARRKPIHYGDMHAAKLLARHLSNDDGSPLRLLDLALPLLDAEGRTGGVLAAHLNAQLVARQVNASLATLTADRRQAASVLDADGHILYDSQGAEGRVVLADGAEEALAWPGETVPCVYATAPLAGPAAEGGLAWRIVLRSPAPALQAAITEAQLRVASIGLGVGALLTLGLGLAAHRLLRPLQRLVLDMQAFGATGRPPPRHRPTRVRELAALQQAFGEMARRVDAHRRELDDSQADVVRALARAGEYRDNETGNHVQRMSQCTGHLGRLAGLSDEQCTMLALAAQLHDVGKIGVADELLHKRGALSPAERAQIQRHVDHGEGILAGLDSPLARLARDIVATHHERWDGQGYPRGLAGEAIPLGGRIVALCDTFDALLSERPYKGAWSTEDTLAYLRAQAGRHFDPRLVALLLADADRFLALRNAVDRHGSEPAPAGPVAAATPARPPPPAADPAPQLSTRRC